ncbi:MULTISPECIES: cupin [unclassified Caballeronia]|uniref:cupin domain-containing protein n=1 Tax=unclassified Caballeronia TaxID=2646786 RepID=UPI00285AC6DD|nr:MULTISPECIES: cupin [unclassified Caballeronia]MDR5751945.1 cupin [Caballeronia sp. LZ024]MDR5843914.1 cupin [Caballeronia sp. LZ031]
MTRDEFLAELAREGFQEIVTVTREPNLAMDLHAHPFEAKALIIAGDLTIRAGESQRHYGPGDVFHLATNAPHSESYGPDGVTYLVGRK